MYNTGRDTTRYLDANVKRPEVISGYIRYKASPDKIFNYTVVHGRKPLVEGSVNVWAAMIVG